MKKKFNKRWLIVLGAVILIAVLIVVILKLGKPAVAGSGGGSGEQIEIVPLSQEQINILGQNVLSSEFIADLPKNGIIGLRFYDFVEGQRIWQSGFLIGKDGFLDSGNPDLVLIMHTKYIAALNELSSVNR